jgi:S1-C subfamily serine protease
MSEYNSSKFLQTVLFLILLSISYSIGLAQDARLIAKNTFPSVVMLEMRDDKNRPISLGSGFFVRPDVVVTNYHVIEGASDGFAKIVGETSIYHIEGVVGIDKTKDLALLKLKGVIGKPLILADISKIEVGQEVFAFGNPKGLEGTISTGIISGSNFRKVGSENLIQITAPISPGSSGGPVVNRKGEVIGVAVASLKDGQNLNFAVPSSYLAILLANPKSPVSLSSVTQSTMKNLHQI